MRSNRARAASEKATRTRQANAEEEVKAAPARSNAKPAKRKRKFPYRKIEDLEKDIAACETVAAELEASLASAETYRDANKFRDTMKAFEDEKAKLARLYEHWEEANYELNPRRAAVGDLLSGTDFPVRAAGCTDWEVRATVNLQLRLV